MQLRFTTVRLAVAATFAASGMAAAQTETPPAAQAQPPPADQAQAPATSTQTQSNPTDPNIPSGAAVAGDTGVAGGPSAGRKKAEEEIVVTGSRVRRKDLTTPAPVTVINREQISASGIASIGDFLQQIPEQGGATNTNVNNGGDGETQISLRNLGAQRTLVLVDGKRWVNGGSGAGTAVDLNSIPTAAIERVEVLKDGASAVYGSDAIGGVVNIITRRRVNGTELSAYGGLSPHGDAQQYEVDVTSGATGDRGNFMFTAGYFDQKPMLAGARSWANKPLDYNFCTQDAGGNCIPGGPSVTSTGSTATPGGYFSLDLTNCNGNALCAALATKYGKIKHFHATYDPANPASIQGFRKFVPSGAVNDRYNYQAVNYLITPSTRIQFFTNGEYHLSDYARAYVQGSFVNRQSNNQLAPEPLFTIIDGITVSSSNEFNPFGQDIGDARRRIVEAGPRQQGYDLNTIRAVAGIDGTLPDDLGPLQGLFYDFSFSFGRTSGVTTTVGSFNTQLIANGIGPSYADAKGVYHCGTAANPIGGNCTPVNLFGGPGSITPAMVAALGGYKGINDGWTQLADLQANVSDELFHIASERPVGIAAGYEYRDEYAGYIPNAIAQQGLDTDYNGLPTQGSYHVNEAYAELDMPIVSNIAFAEDLELQAAIRGFDYSTFGTGTTYKLGGRWRPVHDVTLRGTYSTGFRAPDVADLYGGQGPSAESAADPCSGANAPIPVGSPLYNQCGAKAANNGDTNTQINSTVGGNPLLQPEKAKIWTAGLVYEPAAVRNLSVTFDYYNINVYQELGFNTTAVILQGCYPAGSGSTAAPNQAFCNLITRDPTTQVITNVQDLEANVGQTWTSGVDAAARYAFPATDYGRFGLLFDGTYLIKYDYSVASGKVFHAAGNYDAGSGSAISNLTPHVKFNAGVNYGLNGFNAGIRGRFIGGFTECANQFGDSAGGNGPGFCTDQNVDASGKPYPIHSVPANLEFDIFASYLIKSPIGGTTFSVGVRNVFDTNPPPVYNSFLTYADPGYDFIGRFVYARVDHKF